MAELMNFEERARAVLPPHISAYYAAAGSGVGLDEGTVDWSAVRFRPRILREVGSILVSTTVLGAPVRTPVLVAPMAQQVGAHPDGEVAMGRAVAATGSLLGVSTTRNLCRQWHQVRGARCGCHRYGSSSDLHRPTRLWALAAAGQESAQQVIKSLTDELAQVMVQLGAASIDELTPDLLSV